MVFWRQYFEFIQDCRQEIISNPGSFKSESSFIIGARGVLWMSESGSWDQWAVTVRRWLAIWRVIPKIRNGLKLGQSRRLLKMLPRVWLTRASFRCVLHTAMCRRRWTRCIGPLLIWGA